MTQIIKVIQWINISIILTELAIVFRSMKKRVHFFLYMICISMLISGFGYLMSLYCHTEEALFMMDLFSRGGKVFAIITTLHLCLCLSNRKRPKIYQILEAILAGLTCIIIITTRETGLFYSGISMESRNGRYFLAIQRARGIIFGFLSCFSRWSPVY